MKRSQTAQLNFELNMAKIQGIKPNFTQIGKKYGVDRHTVARYYKEGGKAIISRDRPSYLNPYLEEIEQMMITVHPTKKAAFEFFRKKYGKEVFRSYSTFSHLLKEKQIDGRVTANTPHPRFETSPGEQLQVDWVEDLSMELKSGEIIEYNLFSATWSYSRLHMFVYTKTKTTEDFMRCLLEVLYQSSGAPKEILTDNMSAVVSVRGSKKRKHQQIINFEKDTGIKIRLCQVRSPQTKGKCESANRYVQWLKPYQKKLENEEDLLKQIQDLNKQINRETNQTTGIPPVVLFGKEKEHLDPLPSDVMLESYLQNISVQTVPPTLLVRYKGNGYSVNQKFIGKRVKLIPVHDKLYIYYNTQIIASHTISCSPFNYRQDDYHEALKVRIPSKEDDEIDRIVQDNLRIFGSWSEEE